MKGNYMDRKNCIDFKTPWQETTSNTNGKENIKIQRKNIRMLLL
jgi:hypothetical protein